MAKLTSLNELAKKARETAPAVGISRDLDAVAERIAKGKRARGKFHNGTVVNGVVFGVTNGGFRGLEVHLWVGTGAARVHRVVSMDTVRIWS